MRQDMRIQRKKRDVSAQQQIRSPSLQSFYAPMDAVRYISAPVHVWLLCSDYF